MKRENVVVKCKKYLNDFEFVFEDENGVVHYDIEVMKDNSGVWQRINNNYE